MGDFMDRLVWITAIVLAICVLTSCGGKPEQAAGEAAIEKAIEASDSLPFEQYRQEYVSPHRLGEHLPCPE